MAKQHYLVAQCVLMEFARLNEPNQRRFINQMNEFLMASPAGRKSLVAQWELMLQAGHGDQPVK
ncbi:hypothetical protein ACN9M1_12795 [Ralstonia sp. R-29]|uniref:hypothetical protein n=1 Tax=Ralstonia sp. R-29 TaxID=3404059 RepID=UPI003CF1C372